MAKCLVFGEALLRLATGKGERLAQVSQLNVNYGGSEMNVGLSLAQLGHEVAFATVLPDNMLGEGCLQLLRQHGVETTYISTRSGRMGTYYLETGSGNRASQVVYDRAHSSFADAESLAYSPKELLAGRDLLFVSGITLALSETLRQYTIDLIKAAHAQGVTVVYDNNYREKLWPSRQAAFEVTKAILPYVTVASLGLLDARALYGDEAITDLASAYARLAQDYPQLQVLFSTKRETLSAEDYQLQAFVYQDGQLTSSDKVSIRQAIDRIGAGDAYAAGVIHAFLRGDSPQDMAEFGLAATVLKHSYYGDVNLATESEIENYRQSGVSNVSR